MAKTCRPTKVVDNELCTIKYCGDCESVSLNLGSMTLHLTADQFEGLSKSFAKGMKEIRLLDQTSMTADTPVCSTPERFH